MRLPRSLVGQHPPQALDRGDDARGLRHVLGAESVAANVKHVYVSHAHAAVVLTLWSGTRLVDRHDRIHVVGEVDDVAVAELVEAVRRRGWDAVELHGDEAFRRAAARALSLVEPPIVVAGNPLDQDEQDDLADLVARRQPPAPPPACPFAIGR